MKRTFFLLQMAAVLLGCLLPVRAAVVFSEGFSGSTVMAASPAAPTETTTDYAVLSSKNATGSTLLNLSLSSGTSSGFAEMQALFTSVPVTLGAGQSIVLTMTFQGTYLLDSASASQSLNVGLFNSGGSMPVPGGQMANAGMGTGTAFVSGYARAWEGYVGRVSSPGGNGSKIYTREPQTDTSDENQDLLFDNVGTGAYDTPTGQGVSGSGAVINLANGADYTLVFTVLNDGANVQVSEKIYEGAGTGGTLVYSLSGTAPAGYKYTTFDSLAFGARFSSASAPAIQVSALTIESDTPPPPDTVPTISNLDDVTVFEGEDVTLTPTVTGYPAPGFQWQENGSDLVGETNAVLVLPDVQTGQSGNVYTLIAANVAGAATNSMTLTVNADPGPLPAFPGAEGSGFAALGGRGGDVYYVTSLADSGPGSLRYGISSASGPRTILFKVSGNILLASDLSINKSYLTIAGQTAPGDGITLQGRLTSVENCRDVVVRYIRTRPGDLYGSAFQDDAFHFVRATNCIADHVSASWSIDETLSCTHYSTNITVQWCFITESLNNSYHDKGAHGYGSLLRYGSGAITYHHNLYSDHSSRNPRLGDNIKLDFVNNVIYNWGGTSGYNANDLGDNPSGFTNVLNYVGNYLVAGPSTSSGSAGRAFSSGVPFADSFWLYQSGNRIDSNKNGILDGSDTGLSMFSGLRTLLAERYPLFPVSTESAQSAYERVLAFGGASAARDAVDVRVVDEVIGQSGMIIDSQDQVGGFPVLNSTAAPLDADNDGIPDYFEESMGWNPSVPNNNHVNPDGYTDLEWYLNWLAAPHAYCGYDLSVDVDLRQATGGLTNLAFTVADGTNGTATLLADGYTARFTRTTDTGGLADFSYSCSNSVTGVSFGPVRVGIALQARPVLQWARVSGGMEFSWDGSWNLQYLTTSLTNTTGWTAYPDAGNPVTVPYETVPEAVFFRLAE